MCNFHQTSPESHFTQGKVCSIMLDGGRKTLTDKRFIETRNGEKKETEINSEDEFMNFWRASFVSKRVFNFSQSVYNSVFNLCLNQFHIRMRAFRLTMRT